MKILILIKKKCTNILIVLDPVIKASTGFQFQNSLKNFELCLSNIFLITPNIEEAILFSQYYNVELETILKQWSLKTNIF